MKLQDFRDKIPQLNGLDDESALTVLQKNYYPTVDRARMAEVLGIQPVVPVVEGGGMVAAAKSAMGSMVKGAGQVGADFLGADTDNAVTRYGQSVIDANPTNIKSLGDMVGSPWMTVKEAVGNAGGSMGAILGARAVGQGITAASPLAGPAAPVVALLGQAVSWLGPAAIASLPSYGSIREKQIINDPQNQDDWKSKAIAGLGAATVGAIETKFGPQNWALGAMTKEGRAALAEKFAQTTLARGVGYGALKGAAVEGAEELAQNPVEQLASYDNPTTPESLKDTAFGGAMGAVGGGVLGGGMGALLQNKPGAPTTPTAPPPATPAGPMSRAVQSLQPSNFTSTPTGVSMATAPVTEAGPGFNAGNVPTITDYADQQDLAGLVESEQRDQQVQLAQIEQDRIKQAQIEADFANQPTNEAIARASTLEAPGIMAQAFAQQAQPSAEKQTPPAPPPPEPRTVERTADMQPMPLELAQLQVEMDGGEVVQTRNQNGKFAYHVVKETPKADPVKAPSGDILNAKGQPFTNLFAAKTAAGNAGAGYAPVQLGKFAYVVRKADDAASPELQSGDSASPGAVSIEPAPGVGSGVVAGNAVDADTGRRTDAVLGQAGELSIGVDASPLTENTHVQDAQAGTQAAPVEAPGAQAQDVAGPATGADQLPAAARDALEGAGVARISRADLPNEQKPDATPEQIEQVNEAEYQRSIKEGIRQRLGLVKEVIQNEKKTPFKSFLQRFKINTAHTADIFGKNSFKANNILPATFKADGLSLDVLAERAVEYGFLTENDPDKLIAMIQSESFGDKQVSSEFSNEDAQQQSERVQRMDIEALADKMGLPYDNDTSTDRLASMVNRVEDRLKSVPRGTLKADRILKNAQETVARIERKRAQYESELTDFAKLTIAEQDAVLEILTDAEGNPVISRQSDRQTVEQWYELNPTWTNQNGTDTRASEDQGQAGAPVARVAQEGAGNAEPTGAQAQPRSPQAQDGQEGLTATTPTQLRADAERTAQVEQDKAKADKDAEAKAKAERIAKEIQSRQDASADNFTLGQSAEDSLAGQVGIFDAPAESKVVAPISKTTAAVEALKNTPILHANPIVGELDSQEEVLRKGRDFYSNLEDDGVDSPAFGSRVSFDEKGWSYITDERFAQSQPGGEKKTRSAKEVRMRVSLLPKAKEVIANATSIEEIRDEGAGIKRYSLLGRFDDGDAVRVVIEERDANGKKFLSVFDLERVSKQLNKGSLPASVRESKPSVQGKATGDDSVTAQSIDQADPEIKPAKIEDSGEVLEGARKLYAKNYAAKMDEGMGMDTAAVPLSKSWPEPDYQRLIDEGADPWAVAMARAMRDEIPNKPSSWKLKGWVQNVEQLRSMADKAMKGEISRERISTKAETHGLHGWLHKIDLYEAAGHAKSLKGLKFSMGEYGMYGGQTFKPAKKLWTINQPSTSSTATWSNGNWGNDLVVADTKEEAIEKFKAWSEAQGDKAPAEAKAVSFDIYSYRSKPGVFIVGKRINGNKSIDLKEFPTAKEAREYKSSHQAELERLLEAAKFEPSERRESNAPRVGVDHRMGADVTTEQFRDTFGFRGEQFGASMPQAERQSNMNQAYDALMDLAGVIGVPPKALSLNGELGLAFGARGTGGKGAFAAHYERDTTGAVTPNRVVINLTRKNGAGSLAHEFFHAVDNYFARMRGEKAGMLTESYSSRGEGVRPEMVEAFKRLMNIIAVSGVRERSKQLDKKRVKDYWSTGLEMAARSFESYVVAKLQDQNGANDYLANIVPESMYALQSAYPYPVMGEMPAIRAAFDHFFDTVQTKETEQGIAMFSRGDATTQATEQWQTSLRNSASNPQAKDPSMATPMVLREMGAKSAKLVLPRTYLTAILAKHADVPAKVFENLPSMLADPMFIIRHKDGGLRVFVQAETSRGEPVVVGVSVGEDGRINTVTPFNDVGSKGAGIRRRDLQIAQALSRGEKIYAKNKEALEKSKASAAAAPGLIPLHRDSISKATVITRDDVVKRIEAESTAGGAKYSRGINPKGLPTKQVQAIVDAIKSRWANAPEVFVVDSMEDAAIPQAVRDENAKQQSKGATGEPEGFYYAGKVYVVASAMSKPGDVTRVMLHEALGHAGLRGVFGDALNGILKQIIALRKPLVAAKAEAYGLDMSKPDEAMQAAEEVLAEMAQTHPEIGYVKRAIAAIKAWMREHVPGFSDMKLTDADVINDYILPARGFIERGDAGKSGGKSGPDGGVKFSSRDIKDTMTKPLTEKQFYSQYAQHIDRRGRRDGTAQANKESILRDGFKKGINVNAVPPYRGGQPTDWGGSTFGPRKGDVVYLAPKGAWKDAPNGMEVQDGWKPKPYEVIEVSEDYPSMYQEYLKAFNESTAPDGGGDTNPDIRFSMGARLNAAINDRQTKIVGPTTRQHTPAQLRAMANVGFQVETPSLKERAQALWKDAGKKLAQGIVDQFAPVKDLDGKAYGLLRLSKGASGAFEAMLHGGKLKLSDNVYDFDDANKGGVVDSLLIPLQGEHHDFMRWVAANRAERLQGEGKENLFSPQDIADLKTLASGQAAFDFTLKHGPQAGTVTRDRSLIYADSLKTFNAFNKNVLDMAEQSGLIDGAGRQVWEHEFYVPFYRVADEDGGGVRGMNIKGSVVRQQAFKQLKGGKGALNADLLDNTLMNWAHLLDAAAKNRAAKATIEAAERMGVAIGGNQTQLAQMGASISNKNGVVWFMDGGIKRYSLIDKEGDGPYLMEALGALEYAGMRNPVMNAMGAMKHVLTVGVTASPFFKVRNLIRDSVSVIGTSRIGVNPLANVKQGWKLTDPKSDAYFRLLAGGGTIHFGTMLEGSEAKRIQALVESGVDAGTILGDDHKGKAFYRKFIEPGISAYNELGNRGEAINRATLYDQLIRGGMNHADASLQARDLMDFSMQGTFTTIRFLSQTVPFLNARLQGMYKLGRAAKEDPARMSAVIGATALFSIALLAAYSDDDDWKKREEWDRNGFWWFKFGGTAFRIPKPFEIGAMATLAERGFELAFDKEMTGGRFGKQVMTLLGDNLSMNPVPQLIKPIVDVYANKNSFTGRPIESMSMERLKPEYRFNGGTSMTARGLSTAANSVTGLIGVDSASPVQIDHMLRGYFGWLGSFIIGAGDVLARPATSQVGRAAPDMWKTVTGSMISDLRDAPSRYVSQMYDQAKEIDQAYGTWRALQKEGKPEEAKAFAEDNRELLRKRGASSDAKRQLSVLNERIRSIERGSLDAEAKRTRIRQINQAKEKVARTLN